LSFISDFPKITTATAIKKHIGTNVSFLKKFINCLFASVTAIIVINYNKTLCNYFVIYAMKAAFCRFVPVSIYS